MTHLQKEVLSYLFANVPVGYQFFVAFLVAGCRELDHLIRSKIVTKMMGVQDDAAIALLTITISSNYSLFIAIRLVGEEFATVCCTVAIDFIMHLKMTYQIIKESREINDANIPGTNNDMNTNITTLILAELMEGFSPIIYGVGMAMAYYGPNAHLFSSVRNCYWSEVIKDIGPLYITMSILLGVDTLSVLITGLIIWKVIKVNMFKRFSRVLSKYGHFMAILLALNMVNYFVGTDINFGMDETQSFQWISNEGWRNLVNNSNSLTNQQKEDILSKSNLL